MSAHPTTIVSINHSPLHQTIHAPNEKTSSAGTNQPPNKIDILWTSINGIGKQWRENQTHPIPGKQSNCKEYWGDHALKGHGPLLPVLKKFSLKYGDGKLAIDLGSGNSPVTKRLLKNGWQVIAVDNCKSVLNILAQQYQSAIQSGQLQIVEADIAEFSFPEPADLVIVADCLPYTDPSQFQTTWNRIHDLLIKKNGFLIGSLYVMRKTSDSEQTQMVNRAKAFGSWFLPNQKMVRTLLKETGYQIKQLEFRNDPWLSKPVCIQFIATKKK